MPSAGESFFQSAPGKYLVIAAIVFCLAGVGYMVYGAMKPNAVVAEANDRVFIDSATGQAFHVKLDSLIGQSIPIKAPSGQNTGYPAELCYWTKDGQAKTEPTAVLLNQEIGKPGPTFCPDCGRLVVGHNPRPGQGVNPPPTKEEWEKRHSH
ncbi:MAG: hypothetical protein ACTHN5_08080 [Phycisphaerae bacterium]